jgi:hypothetical protein
MMLCTIMKYFMNLTQQFQICHNKAFNFLHQYGIYGEDTIHQQVLLPNGRHDQTWMILNGNIELIILKRTHMCHQSHLYT